MPGRRRRRFHHTGACQWTRRLLLGVDRRFGLGGQGDGYGHWPCPPGALHRPVRPARTSHRIGTRQLQPRRFVAERRVQPATVGSCRDGDALCRHHLLGRCDDRAVLPAHRLHAAAGGQKRPCARRRGVPVCRHRASRAHHLAGQQAAARGDPRPDCGNGRRGREHEYLGRPAARAVHALAVAVVGDPARNAARDRCRNSPGVQRAEHPDHSAAAHALHGNRERHGLHDLALLHHAARRRDPRDSVQHAGRGRSGRDDARRLSDDEKGSGATGPGAVLCGFGVRRPDHHRHDHGDASPSRPARALFPQRRNGRGDRIRSDVDRSHRRAGPAQGHHRRPFRADDRNHRRRSRVRHAARDLRPARALRRCAPDPGPDRTVCDLRSVHDARKRDHREPRGSVEGQRRAMERHSGGPAAHRKILVADGLDLVDRPGHRHPAWRRLPPSLPSSPTTIRSCSRGRRNCTAPVIRPASSLRNPRTTA